MNKFKQVLALLLTCFSMCAFAQGSPGKLAVYAFGASDAGVNSVFTAKLLASLVQSGGYSEIEDTEAFYNEFAKPPTRLDQISESAKRHGADFVCAVNLKEAFGAYSIQARMVKTADVQVLKTVSIDRSLKSLEDLTAVSSELAQLFHPQAPPPIPIVAPDTVVPETVPIPIITPDIVVPETVAVEPPPPPAPASEKLSDNKENSEEKEKKEEKSIFSLGIRTGLNFSHLYADYYDPYEGRSISGSYNDILGFQLGLVFDIAFSSWFHIQPGFMYIQKGADDMTAHYIDIPLLMSFKLSALRVNAGPYFGICLASTGEGSGGFEEPDFGLNFGIGVDIGMFYIGAFYNYGLFEINSKSNFEYSTNFAAYNRTLGFNLGVNL